MAEHLDRGQRPAEAADAYLEAARSQFGRHRHDEALLLAERGAALAPEGTTGAALARLRGDLLRELGRTEDSTHACRMDRGPTPRARIGARHRRCGAL